MSAPPFEETPFDDNDDPQETQEIKETTFTESSSMKKLLECERIYIRRPKDPDQIMVSYDVTKKFEVLDQNGDPLYYMVQEDSCCSRLVLTIHLTFQCNVDIL